MEMCVSQETFDSDAHVSYKKNLQVFRGDIEIADVAEYYDEWAVKSYDEDHEHYYNGPKIIAETADKLLKNQHNVSILDVGAGTGIVGSELCKKGFTNIGALDPSQQSLYIAEGKGVYTHYFCSHFPSLEPVLDDDVYDVIVSSGALGPGHIPCIGLNEMIRVVKPDGLIMIAMRERYLLDDEFKDRLEPYMKELQDAGKWSILISQSVPYYYAGLNGRLYAFSVKECGFKTFSSTVL